MRESSAYGTVGRRAFCAGLAAAACRPARAAEPTAPWARIDPVLRQRLGRGVSLSHWFWTPVGGRASGDPGYLADRELAQLAGLGFGHVSLPLDLERLYAPEGSDRDLLLRLDGALDRIAAADLLTLVVPFGVTNRWTPERRELNRRLVERCAEHLAVREPRELAYAVTNEPLGIDPHAWSALQADLVAAVRARLPRNLLVASAPLRPLADGTLWGAHGALMQTLPPRDANLVMSLHWYEPFWLTHAGAPWLNDEERAEVEAHDGRRYRDSEWQRSRLAAELERVAAWAAAEDVPLYIGEFGAFRYGGAPAIEREAWASDCVDLFARFALPWCWWDYGEGFGLATGPAGGRQIDPALARALLRPRP